MADYGQYESSRQNSQPAELYKFFTGGGSVAGSSATPGAGEGAVFGSTLPSCEGSAMPTSSVVENWTGGNDTDVAGRSLVTGPGTWAQSTGSSGTLDIVSGVATHSVGGFPVYQVSSSGLGNDQSVTVTGKFTTNPNAGASCFFGAVVRHATGLDAGYVLVCKQQRDGGGVLTNEISLNYWNDPDFTTPQTYTGTAFTLDVTHTIRLDVVGDKIYGYLDDDLVVFGTNADLTSGAPGIYMGRTSSGVVAVTRWEAGTALDPGDDEEVAAYGVDTFDGANNVEINGREFDGGGTLCLADASWTKVLARPEVHGDIVGNTLQVTERVDANPLNWAHYVSTDLVGIGNDYRVESTWNLTTMPTGIVAPNSAWASLLARHSATTESGYEFIAQVVPSAAHGGTGSGGMAFSIDRIVAESYTTLVEIEALTGEIALGAHSIAIHVVGNKICGFYDGELVVVAVDPLNLYPTGYPGFCLCGSEITLTRWGVHADTADQPCGTALASEADALITMNYTSADVDIVYEGDTYVPFIAHRTAFKSGQGERTAAEIDLSLPFDHPVSVLAMSAINRGPIGVIVYRLDRQDTTDGAAAIPLQGQITRHRIEGRRCIITLGNIGTLLTRKLPRILTQRTCPHVLGGPFCRADLTTKTHTALTVSQISGRKVTVDGSAALAGTDASYFQEGVLRTDDGLSVYIEGFDAVVSGDVLTMIREVEGLDIGDTVTLVAGCDHKAATCDTRWVNIEHFGGEIGMPDRNPFTGGGLA